MSNKPGGVLDRSRETEIAELAEFIADEHAPSGKVDPLAIAKEKDITTSFNYYGDAFDGMLEHSAGRFHIYCNLGRVEQPQSPRARFTLGHELGHFFIDEHRNALASGKVLPHPSKCEYESDLEVEMEADTFASNLLMPSHRFLTRAKIGKVGLPTILDLASYFEASVTGAAVRYVKADIVPCAVLKWAPDRFQWKWLSTETWRANFRKTVESIEQLPDDCPTRRALRGEAMPQQGFFQAGTTAAAWFPFLASYDYRNSIFIEQAVMLGRFGVLTFIYPMDGVLR
jgi:hypothetical protein